MSAQGIPIGPQSAATEAAEWVKRGSAHQREGRPIDAMLCFRRASRADPRAPDPYFTLGEVLWQLGKPADAIAAWREAVRLAPNYLAPWQALAEAALATGDAKSARAAAERVQALDPGNARAELIAAIARTIDDGDGAGAMAAIDGVLAREPTLAAIPTLAGPLAVSIDRMPDAPGRVAVLERVARSPEALSEAPLLLLALALEHAAAGAGAKVDATRASLVEAAKARHVVPADVDALRRITVATARFDHSSAREFAARHAFMCATFMSSSVPLSWPSRTKGERTRVLLLASEASAEAVHVCDLLDAIAQLAPDAFAITVATPVAPPITVPAGASHMILPSSADAAARAIAALDIDILVDMSGMTAATGPLLAQHPARQTWTAASLPHLAPLVDRAFDDTAELAAALRASHDARGRADECPLDAAAMAAVWTAALGAHQQGHRATALAGYARVLELQPGHAPAHHLSGVVRREDGAIADAREAFAAALALAPRYVEARIAAANAALADGDIDSAMILCEEGLAAGAANVALLRILGRAHLARRDGPRAAEVFARALQMDMTDGETHYNLGVALQMQRRYPEAARAYQRALAFRPDFVGAHFNLGVLFQQQGMTDAAIAAYGEVHVVDPAHAAAYRNLGEVLLAAGRIDAYLDNFLRFEARCPDALPLAVQALVACQHLGDFAKLDSYLNGLRGDRFEAESEAEIVDGLEELLYLLLYFDVEPAMVEHFSRMYDQAARRAYGDPLPAPPARRPGRVRIGYLSADLRNHVMGKMAWSAVEHHDKARFELFFYSLSEVDDEWTAKFRGLADHFHVIRHETEREAAMRIAEDDLDILVDLSTHTKGARPGILALKPARLQVTHIASAGTLGLSTIDFKLTDAFADVPLAKPPEFEAPLPMEGCVYPYRHVAPAAEHPFRRASLGIAADAIVIGAFASPLKLSRRCLALWRDVLARIPRALLAFSPVDPSLRGSFGRLIKAAGIAQNRCLFVPQGRDDAENQARYALVDFVLDPMPYGGVNGTLEALDMGMPVVTLQGKRHGERTSFSILANLGVSETVATTGTEYADIAVRLATDPVFMRAVRSRIEEGLRQSVLTDVVGHTRALERAYLAALSLKGVRAN